MAQPFQVFWFAFQGVQRQPHQVIEIHRAAIGQAALVVGVDADREARQVEAPFRWQQREQIVWRPAQVFGLLDEIAGQLGQDFLKATPRPTGVNLWVKVLGQGVAPFGQALGDNIALNLLRLFLVEDDEVVGQPDKRRALVHNVAGQAVQSAHPVADVPDQPVILGENLSDAGAEAVDRRVGESDDEHLLIRFQTALGDESRRQVRQGEGLAAARHRCNAQLAAAVAVHNGLLFRAQAKSRLVVGSHDRSSREAWRSCWRMRSNGPRCS